MATELPNLQKPRGGRRVAPPQPLPITNSAGTPNPPVPPDLIPKPNPVPPTIPGGTPGPTLDAQTSAVQPGSSELPNPDATSAAVPEIPRPDGVPDTHHLMWVDHTVDPTTGRSLAMDLHQFYGQSGHVIPHHFAPMHNQLMRGQNGSSDTAAPALPENQILPVPPTPSPQVVPQIVG